MSTTLGLSNSHKRSRSPPSDSQTRSSRRRSPPSDSQTRSSRRRRRRRNSQTRSSRNSQYNSQTRSSRSLDILPPIGEYYENISYPKPKPDPNRCMIPYLYLHPNEPSLFQVSFSDESDIVFQDNLIEIPNRARIDCAIKTLHALGLRYTSNSIVDSIDLINAKTTGLNQPHLEQYLISIFNIDPHKFILNNSFERNTNMEYLGILLDEMLKRGYATILMLHLAKKSAPQVRWGHAIVVYRNPDGRIKYYDPQNNTGHLPEYKYLSENITDLIPSENRCMGWVYFVVEEIGTPRPVIFERLTEPMWSG